MADAAFEFASFLRQDLPAQSSRDSARPRYNFGTGNNDPEMIPAEALASAAASALRRHGRDLAMYNMGQSPLGFAGLRDFLAEKLHRTRGMNCGRDDILITTGSLQGIDLVNDVLLKAGDTVVVEEFTYIAVIKKLRQRGVTIASAPLDHGGLRIDALRSVLASLKSRDVTPRYIYTIPTIQNPTGTVLSLERRRELLELAREHGIPIFEDECYADLVWSRDAPPSLYSLAPRQVIHIGSFSKSLAPALRIGYAVADWEILGRMLACKDDGGTAALEQMIVAEYFSGNFDQHISSLSNALQGKYDVMVEALEREFGTAAEIWPLSGGLFAWVKLPDQVDVRAIAPAAAEAGVSFNAGPDWSCNPEAGKNYLRLCFALPTKQEIRDGVAELARACFEQTGIPRRSANRAREQSAPVSLGTRVPERQ